MQKTIEHSPHSTLSISVFFLWFLECKQSHSCTNPFAIFDCELYTLNYNVVSIISMIPNTFGRCIAEIMFKFEYK